MPRFLFPGGGLFGGGGGGGGVVPASTPLPTESDAEVKRKADATRIAAQQRKGLLSTNLTASTDVGDSDPEVTRKRLGDGDG
jgi:hypothetical protein